MAEIAPAALDRVLKKCLEKDPDNRWQSARDLKYELEWIAAGGGTEVRRQAKARPTWVWMAAAAGLALALTAGAAWTLKPTPLRPVTRTVIDLGPGERLANLDTPAVAISPDGANIVYVASRGSGPAQLFLRPLNALKAEPITGTEGAASPFFSPDSQWIAFFAGSNLKKAAVAGGAAVTLADVGAGSTVRGGTWGPNDVILFQSLVGAFLEVPASGGTTRRVAGGTKNPVLTLAGIHAQWRGGCIRRWREQLQL